MMAWPNSWLRRRIFVNARRNVEVHVAAAGARWHVRIKNGAGGPVNIRHCGIAIGVLGAAVPLPERRPISCAHPANRETYLSCNK